MQSESFDDENSMVCLSQFLERGRSEDCWGGPDQVHALLDDGVPPGLGEEELREGPRK